MGTFGLVTLSELLRAGLGSEGGAALLTGGASAVLEALPSEASCFRDSGLKLICKKGA